MILSRTITKNPATSISAQPISAVVHFDRSNARQPQAGRSSASIKQEICAYEYSLLLSHPELDPQTLTSKLFHCAPDTQACLIRRDPGSLCGSKISFIALCPNAYIQKLRVLYFMLLSEGYHSVNPALRQSDRIKAQDCDKSMSQKCAALKNSIILETNRLQGKFRGACDHFRSMLYQLQEVSMARKKYIAEFFQFLEYDMEKIREESCSFRLSEHQNVVINIMNKYPIMDEIFIDGLITLISKQAENNGGLSLDDNLNIRNFLTNCLNLESLFTSNWEFRLEGIEVAIGTDRFSLEYNRNNYFAEIAEYLNQGDALNGLDVSKVESFDSQIFNKMQKSYIGELFDVMTKISDEDLDNSALAVLKQLDRKPQQASSFGNVGALKPRHHGHLKMVKSISLVCNGDQDESRQENGEASLLNGLLVNNLAKTKKSIKGTNRTIEQKAPKMYTLEDCINESEQPITKVPSIEKIKQVEEQAPSSNPVVIIKKKSEYQQQSPKTSTFYKTYSFPAGEPAPTPAPNKQQSSTAQTGVTEQKSSQHSPRILRTYIEAGTAGQEMGEEEISNSKKLIRELYSPYTQITKPSEPRVYTPTIVYNRIGRSTSIGEYGGQPARVYKPIQYEPIQQQSIQYEPIHYDCRVQPAQHQRANQHAQNAKVDSHIGTVKNEDITQPGTPEDTRVQNSQRYQPQRARLFTQPYVSTQAHEQDKTMSNLSPQVSSAYKDLLERAKKVRLQLAGGNHPEVFTNLSNCPPARPEVKAPSRSKQLPQTRSIHKIEPAPSPSPREPLTYISGRTRIVSSPTAHYRTSEPLQAGGQLPLVPETGTSPRVQVLHAYTSVTPRTASSYNQYVRALGK